MKIKQILIKIFIFCILFIASCGKEKKEEKPEDSPSLSPDSFVLSEGEVALDENHFPDAFFREYLYYYYDKNQDHILTQEERKIMFELGDVAYNGKTEAEKEERKKLLRQVSSFEGIDYFENLRYVVLGEEYKAEKLHLDNPKMEQVRIECRGRMDFSVERAAALNEFIFWAEGSVHMDSISAENLEKLCISGTDFSEIPWENMKKLKYLEVSAADRFGKIDLGEIRNLKHISLKQIQVDLSLLMQNKDLLFLSLEDCSILKPLDELDFSGMENLENVRIWVRNAPKEYWAGRIVFGNGFQNSDEWENWIEIDGNIAPQIILRDKGVCCKVLGDDPNCELIYLDEIRKDMQPLPEDSVWNGAENFPDVGLRRYLYHYVDVDRDNILTADEREGVERIADVGYNYDQDARWNEENAWRVEDDISRDIVGITSLQGLEYFPALKRVQLEKLELSDNTKEIVLCLPELEILDIRFDGNVGKIDLTACKKLRVCVIDSDRDDDFVQVIKPEILLPEHLEFENQPGFDCAVGLTF